MVADTSLPIRVNNPRKLDNWQLPAERIVLGPTVTVKRPPSSRLFRTYSQPK